MHDAQAITITPNNQIAVDILQIKLKEPEMRQASLGEAPHQALDDVLCTKNQKVEDVSDIIHASPR